MAWITHKKKCIENYKGAVFYFFSYASHLTLIVVAALLINSIHQEYILSSGLESL